MLPLCTSVTDLRSLAMAYWIAARTRRFDPVIEIGLIPMAESGRMSQPNSREEFGWDIRPDSAIGIKPISITGSKRLVRAAIQYAIANDRKSVTLVHKGNIMKFTEGAFRTWGYELAKDEFADEVVS